MLHWNKVQYTWYVSSESFVSTRYTSRCECQYVQDTASRRMSAKFVCLSYHIYCSTAQAAGRLVQDTSTQSFAARWFGRRGTSIRSPQGSIPVRHNTKRPNYCKIYAEQVLSRFAIWMPPLWSSRLRASGTAAHATECCRWLSSRGPTHQISPPVVQTSLQRSVNAHTTKHKFHGHQIYAVVKGKRVQLSRTKSPVFQDFSVVGSRGP